MKLRTFPTCNTEGRALAWHTPFKTWAEADAHCTGGGVNTEGYAEASVHGCATMRSKLAAERTSIGSISIVNTRILTALFGLRKQFVRVLDVGGGAGLHYFVARAISDKQVQFCWNVVETPALCEAAASVANSELAFFDNIERAVDSSSGFDLIFLSGVLQLLPEPIEMLERCASLNPSVLCIARTAMSVNSIRHVVIQEQASHGPPTNEYPVILEHRASYEAVLNSRFGKIMRIVEEEGVYKVEGDKVHMFGYLCQDPK